MDDRGTGGGETCVETGAGGGVDRGDCWVVVGGGAAVRSGNGGAGVGIKCTGSSSMSEVVLAVGISPILGTTTGCGSSDRSVGSSTGWFLVRLIFLVFGFFFFFLWLLAWCFLVVSCSGSPLLLLLLGVRRMARRIPRNMILITTKGMGGDGDTGCSSHSFGRDTLTLRNLSFFEWPNDPPRLHSITDFLVRAGPSWFSRYFVVVVVVAFQDH